MFNKEKLKNLFKSKSTIIKDEFDKIGETSTYELDILEIGDNVKNVSRAARISHGLEAPKSYQAQCDYIERIMKMGHDSISGHSNIQFAITIHNIYDEASIGLVKNLEAFKFFNIEVIHRQSEEGTVTVLVFGASIRSLRYYIRSISEVSNLNFHEENIFNYIKGVIYKTTEKCFYPDLIKDGYLDEEDFEFVPIFNEYDTDFDNPKDEPVPVNENDIINAIDKQNFDIEEEKEIDDDKVNSINPDELTQETREEFTVGNVDIIDYPTENYKSSIDTINNKFPSEIRNEKLLNDIIHSLIATSTITIKINKMSRAISQQINRHRTAITQESQRYVNVSDCEFINPCKFDPNKYPNPNPEINIKLFGNEVKTNVEELGKELIKIYGQLLDQGLLKQDARGFLPFNAESSAYYTFTMSDMIHFLSVRLHKSAQPEVRTIASFIYSCLIKDVFTDKSIIDIIEYRITNTEVI
jgi:flavin-dependent thymidylate synthase